MPNARVLWSFPLLLLVAFIVLVATGVNGTSTGALHSAFYNGSDPALISGTPQPVRSDEYLVQAGWTASQVEQGLPVRNRTFPGGIDTTVQGDFPSSDWSVAFRPHLLGFFVLPLSNASAVKWWLPGFVLMLAVYLFAVTMMPRRPFTGAALAIGFFFAPFFQWWFQPVTFWPAAWAFLTMAAMVWMLRSPRRWHGWAWAAAVAYVTVTMGFGIYVPFIVPAVFVVLFFGIGLVAGRSPAEPLGGVLVGSTFVSRLKSLIPLFAAGAAAVVVLVIWMLTRWGTIQSLLGTVYPGQRLVHTGTAKLPQVVALLGAPFTRDLGNVGGQPFGSNPSEGSTFFLVGLFLLVPAIWLLARDRRALKATDSLLVGLLGLAVLFAAFMLVPGWDAIAHLLQLDRTTLSRLRMGWGILSVVVMIVIAQRIDGVRSSGGRVPRSVVIGSAALALLGVAGEAGYLAHKHAAVVTQAWSWVVVGLLFVLAVTAVARGHALTGAAAFMVASLIGSAGVNPVYVGVLDLNQTAVVKSMKKLEAREPGRWVGLGQSRLATAALVQSGLPGYNGFQASPPHAMWKQIDPTGADEFAWNRLANLSWVAGEGAPAPHNPAPDAIEMTFDSCAPFAQEHVAHVLSDAPVEQACLTPVQSVRQGPTTFYLYSVAKG